MSDSGQAVREGIDLLKHGKQYGVPVGIFLVSLLLVAYAVSWGADKETRIEHLEKNNQVLSKDVEKLKAGETVYQRWQEDVIRRISESVGAGTPPPIPRARPRTFGTPGGGNSPETPTTPVINR